MRHAVLVLACAVAVGCGAPTSPAATPPARPAAPATTPAAPSTACTTAAAPPPGALARVAVRGADAALCDVITSRAGAPRSDETVEADIRRLYEGGAVEGVEVVEESEGAATVLVFEVEPRRTLARAELVGAPREVDGAKALGQVPRHYDPVWVGEAEGRLVDALHWAGYRKGLVRHEATPAGDGAVLLRLNVEPGKRFLLGHVRFEGLAKAPEGRLTKGLSMEVGEPVHETMLERDTLVVSSALYDLGMLESAVRSRVEENFLGSSIDVVFTVTEGPVYTLGDVRIAGPRAFPAARYASALAELKKGSTFVRADVARAIQEVERLHREAGAPVHVDVDTTLDAKKRLTSVVLRLE